MDLSLKNPKSLKPNPWNSNRVGAENMAKLKRSISELSFASAVVCRELSDGSLQILGGHHRVEAAIELGIKEIPVLNLGHMPDDQARKIGLVDNSRYGIDDTISLAKIYEDLGLSSDELASFLPYTDIDFDTVKKAIEIDLDDLDIIIDEDDKPDADTSERQKPQRTHEILKFRVALGDAEKIRVRVEKTMKREGFSDDGDEMTAAGQALAHMLLGGDE